VRAENGGKSGRTDKDFKFEIQKSFEDKVGTADIRTNSQQIPTAK